MKFEKVFRNQTQIISNLIYELRGK